MKRWATNQTGRELHRSLLRSSHAIMMMLAGELYDPSDPELAEARMVARERCRAINQSSPREQDFRSGLFKELFASGGDSVWLEPPFRCDYGTNIYLGEKVYFNFDCVILDVCEVRIGDYVFVAPGLHRKR